MYVDNQMYNMTEIKLKNLFTPSEKISHPISLQIKIPGSPKNMAYVEMAVGKEGK